MIIPANGKTIITMAVKSKTTSPVKKTANAYKRAKKVQTVQAINKTKISIIPFS